MFSKSYTYGEGASCLGGKYPSDPRAQVAQEARDDGYGCIFEHGGIYEDERIIVWAWNALLFNYDDVLLLLRNNQLALTIFEDSYERLYRSEKFVVVPLLKTGKFEVFPLADWVVDFKIVSFYDLLDPNFNP